jgi:hypothetical protein
MKISEFKWAGKEVDPDDFSLSITRTGDFTYIKQKRILSIEDYKYFSDCVDGNTRYGVIVSDPMVCSLNMELVNIHMLDDGYAVLTLKGEMRIQ